MKSLNDQLLDGEKRSNDTTFYERRCYLTNFHMVKFVFLTRCLSGQMRNEIQEIAEGKSLIPDVLLMNSGKIFVFSKVKSIRFFRQAIWDISKYGTNAEKDYASLLEECFRELRRILPEKTVVIWLTAVSSFSWRKNLEILFADAIFSRCARSFRPNSSWTNQFSSSSTIRGQSFFFWIGEKIQFSSDWSPLFPSESSSTSMRRRSSLRCVDSSRNNDKNRSFDFIVRSSNIFESRRKTRRSSKTVWSTNSSKEKTNFTNVQCKRKRAFSSSWSLWNELNNSFEKEIFSRFIIE